MQTSIDITYRQQPDYCRELSVCHEQHLHFIGSPPVVIHEAQGVNLIAGHSHVYVHSL